MRLELEFLIQREFVQWLEKSNILHCASCGGMKTHIKIASKMKQAGYKKGFPDVMIYEPCGPYHGLAIELKSKGGKTTKEQKEWCSELNERGYKSTIMPANLEHEDAIKWLKDKVKAYFETKGGKE